MKTKMSLLIVMMFVGIGSFAGNGETGLLKELKKKVFVDLNGVEINKAKKDFVIVSFRITDGEIKILEVNGTNKYLKEKMIEKLCSLNVESNYDPAKTYNYKFTFDEI